MTENDTRRETNRPHGTPPPQAAPRVTLADVEGSIASEYYFTAREGVAGAGGNAGDALGRLTFCVLALKNGFMATGKSVCVSSANFDPAVGRQIARENALDEIWPVLGYALLDKLAQEGAAQPESLPLEKGKP